MIEVNKLQDQSENPSFVNSELPSTAAVTNSQGGSQKNLFESKFRNDNLSVNQRDPNPDYSEKSHLSASSIFRKQTMKKMGKSAKKLFNFEKTCGISNRVVHHGWNIFMMAFVVILYLYFNTPFIGGYHNTGSGLLALPGIMIPEIPCAILYGITLCSMFDYVFVLGFL